MEDVTDNIERPLGDWLRQRREELGIDLTQAESATRIRRHSLEALEAEEFEALPDSIVGRGFARNYAAYLGLDPAEAAARYSRLGVPPPPESGLANAGTPFAAGSFQPVPLHHMPGFIQRRGWWLGGALLAIAVIVAAVAWWNYPRLSAFAARLWPGSGPTDVATPLPTRTNPPLATPTVAATATSRPANRSTPTEVVPTEAPTRTPTRTPTWTPSPSASPSPPVYTGIFLELAFTGTSWIQVTVDGVREFQGELLADTYRSWYGQERVELRIGNAGAVLVTINGQSLGTLGAEGEVVDQVFEKVGDGVTQATAGPEATSEVDATATSAPADTPAPTDTPPPPADTVAPPAGTPSPTPGR